MTIPLDALRWAILVEAVLLLGLLAFYLVYGHLNNRYRRITRPRVEELRQATMRVLIDPEGMGDLIERLKRAPRRIQVHVFLSLAPSLAGQQRNALVGVAHEIGLISYAAAKCQAIPWWERLEGARLLTALGSNAQVMVELLDDPYPLVRAQAAEWAAEHPDEHLIDKLIEMLHDPEQICRFSARESILEIGEPTVHPFLRHIVTVHQENVSAEEVEVIVGLASPVFLPVALRFADHENPRIRGLACQALGAIGVSEGIDTLVERLDDPDVPARTEAARALGTLGHWPAGPKVARLMQDSSFEVRRASGMALKAMGAPGEVLLRRVTHGDDRYAAAMARHVLDTPGAIPAGRRLA